MAVHAVASSWVVLHDVVSSWVVMHDVVRSWVVMHQGESSWVLVHDVTRSWVVVHDVTSSWVVVHEMMWRDDRLWTRKADTSCCQKCDGLHYFKKSETPIPKLAPSIGRLAT